MVIVENLFVKIVNTIIHNNLMYNILCNNKCSNQ